MFKGSISPLLICGLLLCVTMVSGFNQPVEAKWFIFGKDEKQEVKQVAAASAPAKAQKEKTPTYIQTGKVEAVTRVQDGNRDYVPDMLGNTLTMPMNVLQPLKGTQKGLESLQKPIKELKEPLSRLEPPLKELDKSIDNLKTPIKELETPLSTLTKTTGALNQPIKSVGSNISELKQPLSQLKSPISELKKPLADLGQPVKSLNAPIRDLSKPIGELNQPLVEVAGALNSVRDELFELKHEIQGIESTVERIILYVLLMVSILCVTVLFIFYGLVRFLNSRNLLTFDKFKK